jgi:hypothetical protein
MANIFLRSPYNISQTQQGSGLSVFLTININGVEVYTLTKNKSATSSIVLFEVAELIRDYLILSYNGTPVDANFNNIIILTYTWKSGLNGTGTTQGTPLVINAFGIDAYGYFKEGSNPTTTQGYMQSNNVIYKLASENVRLPIDRNNTTLVNYYFNGVLQDSETITTSTTNVFRFLDDVSDVDNIVITRTGGTTSIQVVNIEECKFAPHKISFINRYGAIQDLWFFKKSIEALTVSKESFKSSGITTTGTYNVNQHQQKTFNVIAKEKITLNSGYVSQDYNEPMQELLQSEQVWMEVNSIVTPMTVTDSNLTFKTSLNDKLVEYKLELEYAFDAINNIR